MDQVTSFLIQTLEHIEEKIPWVKQQLLSLQETDMPTLLQKRVNSPRRERRKIHSLFLDWITKQKKENALHLADSIRSIQALILSLKLGAYPTSLEAVKVAIKYGQTWFCHLELEFWNETPSIPIDFYYKAVEYAIEYSRYRILRIILAQKTIDFADLYQHAQNFLQKLTRSSVRGEFVSPSQKKIAAYLGVNTTNEECK